MAVLRDASREAQCRDSPHCRKEIDYHLLSSWSATETSRDAFSRAFLSQSTPLEDTYIQSSGASEGLVSVTDHKEGEMTVDLPFLCDENTWGKE